MKILSQIISEKKDKILVQSGFFLSLSPYRTCTAKLTKITAKCILDEFCCVYKWVHITFLQLLLCCAKILLEKYPAWQLTMPSSLVVKQNFPNTNVNILIIRNWSGYGYQFSFQLANFLQDVSHTIWNELPYPMLSERYAYFCDILMKVKCTPKMCSQKIHLDVVIRECFYSGGSRGHTWRVPP